MTNIPKLKNHHSKDRRKLVAIAVPLSNRNTFLEEERISLNHLRRHLQHYDRFFIAPESLDIELEDGFRVKRFSPNYFGSAKAHTQLLFSKEFYQAFIDYQYLMIYHLDALVFSDQLAYWCNEGYDYIAPPWIPHQDAPYAEFPKLVGKVGNGGFSLRKIDSFLGILNSKRLWKSPLAQLKETLKSRGSLRQKWTAGINAIGQFNPAVNGVRNELDTYPFNEDHFWANRGQHYLPEFTIAPLETALKFGFECVPRYCFEKTNHELPFGCHAWPKYDKAFWEPFLLTS